MIPLQITLKNFMSYGEQPVTVDLREMPVVCLSGDNGHGKSALLDAITWALWGETRLGKQNQDQLIRLGSDEMAVTLDFAAAGEMYRVRRQRSKRAGSQIWELQIHELGGTWRPLTGTGSGDTGRTIVSLLRMNYETFLNSAYLKQGRADEFVRQTANKRKEILAEILDLSRFDDLEARARIKMRAAQDAAQDATRDISQFDAELAQEPSNRVLLESAQAESLALEAQRLFVQTRIEQLSDVRSNLNVQRERLKDCESQIRSIDDQLRSRRSALVTDQKIVSDLQNLLAEREKIEGDFSKLQAAQARVGQLNADAQTFRELDRKRVTLENEIQFAKRDIERELTAMHSQLVEINSQVIDLPVINKRIEQLSGSATRYPLLQQTRQTLWEDQTRLTVEFAEAKAQKKQSEADLAAAHLRLQNIDNQTEACSICGSPLPPEKLDDLRHEVNASLQMIEAAKNACIADGRRIIKEEEKIKANLADVEKEMNQLESARSELSVLQQRSSDLTKSAELLPALNSDFKAIKADLDENRYAESAQATLKSLLADLTQLRGSELALTQTNREIDGLRGVEGAHARLQSSERELAATLARIEDAGALVGLLNDQKANLSLSLQEADNLDRLIGANGRDLEQVRGELRSVDSKWQRCHQEVSRLNHYIERAEQLRQTRVRREIDLHEAKNEEDVYAMLAGSFGKRGVQALIIENAMPELEQDTNELLDRLTDGEMSVTIQTTKIGKGKSAGDAPIETLEIQISDHMGTRPMEMYSGGEAFRVSFALRIALSKLLARRAGANLQTLIIDEGFGTQDGKGREKLVDAIMAIQSEFAQIIVITHVDELKDAFPNRIEVVKTPAGSEVTVIAGAALG